MALELDSFGDDSLDPDFVHHLLDQHSLGAASHYGRLWDYFRNPLMPPSPVSTENARPYTQAQEAGLPPRITGASSDLARAGLGGSYRKEVVIENDIAWRIHTMIDFLFGRQPTIRSLAADPRLARTIEAAIAAMLDANGGISFLQETALFGCVYGFVDIALRTPAQQQLPHAPLSSAAPRRHDGSEPNASAAGPGTPSTPSSQISNLKSQISDLRSQIPDDAAAHDAAAHDAAAHDRAVAAAGSIILEAIEAPRVLPILDEEDYRSVRYWIQRYVKAPSRLAQKRRWWQNLPLLRHPASQASVEVVEIISSEWWQRYEDRELVAEGPNILGRVPVVHIQNMALPGSYEGLGDVEPLIGLQDELNTRLSDRANRVTHQSFKMYLAKGIDDFLERPVGPGQMWASSNPNASIEEFGADSASPSEESHIDEVRSAMDKVSGVTPLAAGLIRGNVGNLTSATALKVLLGGLLARTAKKRLTYGAGIARIVELALAYMDLQGTLHTTPQDRKIEIHWPNPVPYDEGEQLRNAQIKAQLGLPAEQILAELGYDRRQAQ